MAKKAVCELSPCPVMAKEAVCELSPCPVTAMEAVSEPLLRSGPADRAVPELSSCLFTATEAGYEPLNLPIMSPEFIDEFLVFSDMDALSVSCVSVFLRSQSLLWAPVPSAPPWVTTRGHSSITLTFTPHRQLHITQRLHFPSSIALTTHTQLIALITHS